MPTEKKQTKPATRLKRSAGRPTKAKLGSRLAPPVSSALQQHLPAMLRGVEAHQVKIAQVLAASGQLGDIKVNQVALGSAHIGQLTLSGTAANMRSGSATMQNVRTVMEMQFSLHWWYDVWFDDDEGDEDLFSISVPVDVGGISVPALGNIPFNIPTIHAANVSTNIAPILNLSLGRSGFAGLKATDATVPGDPFQLGGIGLTSFGINKVQAPRVAVKRAVIDSFKPKNEVVVPKVQLGPIHLPSATVSDIEINAAVSFPAIGDKRSLPELSFGFFGFTISVTPVAHVSIGSMRLQGVSIDGLVNQATIQNVSVPIDIRGINLETIDIANLDVSNLSL